MRLASFNVENLFERPRLLRLGVDGSRAMLNRFASLNALLRKSVYSAIDKADIARLLGEMGLDRDDLNEDFFLRVNHGHLLRRQGRSIEIVADGRGDWVGWVDLRTVAVDEVATRNTARVIRDVDADVLAVVEAESRRALVDFNDTLLVNAGGVPYRHVMLIDGNDLRGIDVGILTRDAFPITSIVSHVDDRDADGRHLFDRDCPVYTLAAPNWARLHVLVNHLKSKRANSPEEMAATDRRRHAQAERVVAIYAELLRRVPDALVAICGDFNDSPDSAALQPFAASNLRDVSTLPGFDDGGAPGTFRDCAPENKIDYILCSPSLAARFRSGGIWRKGLWDRFPTRWQMYPDLTSPAQAASDHGAIYADFDL